VSGEKHYCTGLEGAEVMHVLLNAPAADGAWKPTSSACAPERAASIRKRFMT